MTDKSKITFNLIARPERHYAGISLLVEQKDISSVLPPLCDDLINRLAQKNIKPSGAPFFRYLKPQGTALDVEVGVIVNERFIEHDDIKNGSFPSGTYAVASYTGPYDNLYHVHMELNTWCKENKINCPGSRTEFYLTDESKEPNPNNWQTDVEFETGAGESRF